MDNFNINIFTLLIGIQYNKKNMLPLVEGLVMVDLRNKSWKPECVGSFNIDCRILVFYPEPEARDKIY